MSVSVARLLKCHCPGLYVHVCLIPFSIVYHLCLSVCLSACMCLFLDYLYLCPDRYVRPFPSFLFSSSIFDLSIRLFFCVFIPVCPWICLTASFSLSDPSFVCLSSFYCLSLCLLKPVSDRLSVSVFLRVKTSSTSFSLCPTSLSNQKAHI